MRCEAATLNRPARHLSQQHIPNSVLHVNIVVQVSCIALSRSGRYLASGQKTFMGFTADIMIWDLETKQIHKKLKLHKVMVQALAFSHDELKLASLGGPDDGSLVLWDVLSGEAVCGSPANNKFVDCVKFLNKDSTRIITAGQGMPCLFNL